MTKISPWLGNINIMYKNKITITHVQMEQREGEKKNYMFIKKKKNQFVLIDT